MDLWDSLAVLVRRWYAVVPVLLLATLAMGYVVLALPPTYEAKGSVLLLPPPAASGGTSAPDNPYLSFGSSVDVTAGVVAQSIMSDGMAQQLIDQGLPGDYEVGLATEGNGPVINVVVTSTVQDRAARLKDRLCQLISEVLEQRQRSAGAPVGSFITAELISDTPVPHKLLKSKIRAIAILAVLGVAGAVLAAAVVDALAVRRTGRRGSAARGRRRARTPAPTPPVPMAGGSPRLDDEPGGSREVLESREVLSAGRRSG